MNDGRPYRKASDVTLTADDTDLVNQCRRGDSSAFGGLVARYQDRVFNACLRLCGNRNDAEEFTQEAFVKAYVSLDRFDGRASFYTWLFRIAVNLTISAHRKARPGPMVSMHARVADGDGQGLSDRMEGPSAMPHERCEMSERDEAVAKALASLDEEYKSVIVLRDIEALGYTEIADILGVPTGTVKSRLHRARLALREMLGAMPELAS